MPIYLLFFSLFRCSSQYLLLEHWKKNICSKVKTKKYLIFCPRHRRSAPDVKSMKHYKSCQDCTEFQYECKCHSKLFPTLRKVEYHLQKPGQETTTNTTVTTTLLARTTSTAASFSYTTDTSGSSSSSQKVKINTEHILPTQLVDCGEDIKLEIKQEIDSNLDNPISVESQPKAEDLPVSSVYEITIKEFKLEDNV